MNEQVRPQLPAKAVPESAAQVALELVNRIETHEPPSIARDRAYFLTLYSQCLYVVSGGAVRHALERETVAQAYAGELTLAAMDEPRSATSAPANFLQNLRD